MPEVQERQKGRELIPKRIHYCWFGGNEPSELMKKCIESWHNVLPDYEIVEWNEEKIKDLDSPFLKETIANEKWAFASDYVRLFALLYSGGIYLDTDVEVLKPFDDLLKNEFFIGLEECTKTPSIGTATIGAKAGSHILKDLLDEYNKKSFIKENGRCDLTPNPKRFVKYFAEKFKYDAKKSKDKITEVERGVFVYPKSYFSPKDDVRKNTYAIHHFADSWKEAWSIRTWFNFLGFALHIFKREIEEAKEFPLLDGEKVIFSIKLSKNKYFVLIKRENDRKI